MVYKERLKELHKESNNALQLDVIEYYLDLDEEEVFNHLNDVISHGLSSGIAPHLIYYKDTNKYYKMFEIEIWDLFEEERENQGFNSIIEYINSLGGSENVGSEQQFFNLLTWFAFENVSYWLYLEMEDLK